MYDIWSAIWTRSWSTADWGHRTDCNCTNFVLKNGLFRIIHKWVSLILILLWVNFTQELVLDWHYWDTRTKNIKLILRE